MTQHDPHELDTTNALLQEKLTRWVPTAGKFSTAIEGLHLVRRETSNQMENCFTKPSIGVIVQGTKRSIIGSEEYHYGAKQCLVAGVDMPSSFYVIGASAEQPFLAISLNIDKYIITRLVAEIPATAPYAPPTGKGMTINDVSVEVLQAFLRLVNLLESPEQIPVLAPMIIQEIHYRLLIGPQGDCLRRCNTLGSQTTQIAQAITWLRDNFKQPLYVDTLAQKVHMATSTFHRHFKEVTSLSPLQFHKRLRLYEAQRLMLAENEDASSASLAVGYESPTQFNREYKRLFGEPPHRYAMRLR